MKRMIKIIGLMSLIGLIGLIGTKAAEEPQLIVTWRANSYVPADYLGKALPIGGSKIDVAVQLITAGELIDLSEKEVRWYLNNNLAAAGSGRVNFSFTAPDLGQEQVLLRVNLPSYQEQTIDKFVVIPIVKPEALIDEAQLPTFKGLFYFFNVSIADELKIDWLERGQNITLRAQNPDNLLEVAQTTIATQ